MKNMRGVLAVVGFMMVCAPGLARAVDNDNTGMPTSVTGSSRLGIETLGTTLVVQCDVMRDYEYVRDTGEFLGWLGDSYVTNCMEVGGTPGGGQCADPQDKQCMCQHDPTLPFCGGPCKAGDDCGGSGPTPPPPPPPKPKKCAKCREQLQRDSARAADGEYSCNLNWGYTASREQCKRGLTRNGYNPAMDWVIRANNGSPVMCFENPAGRSCVVLPEFAHCVDDYMKGHHEEVVTTPGDTSGGTIKVQVEAGEWTVEGGGELAHQEPGRQVTLPAGDGYEDKCREAFAPDRAKAYSDFRKCEKRAPDRSSTNTCPAPPPGSL